MVPRVDNEVLLSEAHRKKNSSWLISTWMLLDHGSKIPRGRLALWLIGPSCPSVSTGLWGRGDRLRTSSDQAIQSHAHPSTVWSRPCKLIQAWVANPSSVLVKAQGPNKRINSPMGIGMQLLEKRKCMLSPLHNEFCADHDTLWPILQMRKRGTEPLKSLAQRHSEKLTAPALPESPLYSFCSSCFLLSMAPQASTQPHTVGLKRLNSQVQGSSCHCLGDCLLIRVCKTG